MHLIHLMVALDYLISGFWQGSSRDGSSTRFRTLWFQSHYVLFSEMSIFFLLLMWGACPSNYQLCLSNFQRSYNIFNLFIIHSFIHYKSFNSVGRNLLHRSELVPQVMSYVFCYYKQYVFPQRLYRDDRVQVLRNKLSSPSWTQPCQLRADSFTSKWMTNFPETQCQAKTRIELFWTHSCSASHSPSAATIGYVAQATSRDWGL